MSDTSMGYPNDSQSYVVSGAVIKGRAVVPTSANASIMEPVNNVADAADVRGVCYESAADREMVLVILYGSCDAEVLGSIVTGALLTVNALGQFIAVGAGIALAVALEDNKPLVDGRPAYTKIRLLDPARA